MTHKLLKKIVGNFGYKLVEKNFFKNDKIISNKSFLKINKLLDVIFKEKKISNLIQIGANDGKRFDTLNFYIKKHNCKSLLVEPIKEYFQKLKVNYKNCDFVIFENSAISRELALKLRSLVSGRSASDTSGRPTQFKNTRDLAQALKISRYQGHMKVLFGAQYKELLEVFDISVDALRI